MARSLEFDLSELSRLGTARVKPFRLLFAGLIVAFAATLAVSIGINVMRDTLLSDFVHTYGIPYVGLPVVIGLCFWAVRVFGPAADRLSLEGEGVVLRFPSGLVSHLEWNDPSFALDLWDWSDHANVLPESALYEAAIRLRPRTYVPESVFRKILDAAREHGLSATVRVPSRVWTGVSARQIRIRSKRATA